MRACSIWRWPRSTRSNRVTRPPADMPRRFLLLHRDRRWSESEQRWIGWERKRGKLMRADRMAGGARKIRRSSIWGRDHARSTARPTWSRWTAIPNFRPGVLHALVAVTAHPANRPLRRYHTASRRRRLSAFCSRASSRHCRCARSPSSTGCSPANAVSIPTARPLRRCIRICSTKAPSAARVCSTCRRFTRC